MFSSELSAKELKDITNILENLKAIGIVSDYDITKGSVSICDTFSAIRRMERHAFNAFKLAFPDSIIRKTAIDFYLASLMNNNLKMGLDKNSIILSMLLSLEKENQNQFKDLSKILVKEFSHYNFEKIKLQ
jgi:hypothetical protein